MIKTYINTLSANNQFKNIQQTETHLKKLIDVMEYLLPAVKKTRACLIYDDQIENRALLNGQNFAQTLNNLKSGGGGKDIVLKWYLFTRKHCFKNTGEILETETHSHTGDDISTGLAAKMTNGDILLSIGGTRLTECPKITVRIGAASETLDNAYSLDTIHPLTPRYEASDKHRLLPYTYKGVIVSPMPIDSEEAQILLLESVTHGSDNWAYRSKCGNYFRYKRTHTDRLIYHGFQVDLEEVPAEVVELLKN